MAECLINHKQNNLKWDLIDIAANNGTYTFVDDYKLVLAAACASNDNGGASCSITPPTGRNCKRLWSFGNGSYPYGAYCCAWLFKDIKKNDKSTASISYQGRCQYFSLS